MCFYVDQFKWSGKIVPEIKKKGWGVPKKVLTSVNLSGSLHERTTDFSEQVVLTIIQWWVAMWHRIKRLNKQDRMDKYIVKSTIVKYNLLLTISS